MGEIAAVRWQGRTIAASSRVVGEADEAKWRRRLLVVDPFISPEKRRVDDSVCFDLHSVIVAEKVVLSNEAAGGVAPGLAVRLVRRPCLAG